MDFDLILSLQLSFNLNRFNFGVICFDLCVDLGLDLGFDLGLDLGFDLSFGLGSLLGFDRILTWKSARALTHNL